MNSYGQDKVLFGTDWPVIDPRRAIQEIKDHNLRPEPHEKLMRLNALQVFPQLTQRLDSMAAEKR